jgi:hypothetical protein
MKVIEDNKRGRDLKVRVFKHPGDQSEKALAGRNKLKGVIPTARFDR